MPEKKDPWQRPDEQSIDATPQIEEIPGQNESRLIQLWRHIRRLGLGDSALRTGTAIATILLALLVVWVIDTIYLDKQPTINQAALIANAESATLSDGTLPTPFFHVGGSEADGVSRTANLHTTLPKVNVAMTSLNTL